MLASGGVYSVHASGPTPALRVPLQTRASETASTVPGPSCVWRVCNGLHGGLHGGVTGGQG